MQYRITKKDISMYSEFLSCLERIVEARSRIGITQSNHPVDDDIYLFFAHIDEPYSIQQAKIQMPPTPHLTALTGIPNHKFLGKLRYTKFVQVKDFSMMNFLLSTLDPREYNIHVQHIEIPSHIELKTILVPEQFITKQSQDTIYNADWI